MKRVEAAIQENDKFPYDVYSKSGICSRLKNIIDTTNDAMLAIQHECMEVVEIDVDLDSEAISLLHKSPRSRANSKNLLSLITGVNVHRIGSDDDGNQLRVRTFLNQHLLRRARYKRNRFPLRGKLERDEDYFDAFVEQLAGMLGEFSDVASCALKDAKAYKVGHPEKQQAREFVCEIVSAFQSADGNFDKRGSKTKFYNFVKCCFSCAGLEIQDPWKTYVKATLNQAKEQH